MNSKTHLIIIFLLSFFIVALWFKNGLLFGAAEEGIPFYSPARTATIIGSVWQRDSTGFLAPILLSEYPLLLFVKYLNIILPQNIAQAFVFFLFISSGLIGEYLLANKITGNKFSGLISSLFYLLNLYVISQVLQRAIYGLMFGWAFLPLFLFLWMKLLDRNNVIRWLIAFATFQIVFSYAYSMPSNIFVFWIPAGLYFLWKIIKQKSRPRNVLNLVLIGLTVGVVWVIVNFWWLYPAVSIGDKSYSSAASPGSSLESLQAVSKSFPISQILQLRQKFYFDQTTNKETPWGNFYNSYQSISISSFGFLIVVWGIIKLKKTRYFAFLISLFLIALFISKGTNPPFGFSFYNWLFTNIPFMVMFRNSYEKLGVVFLLPYAIFFGVGITEILNKFKNQNLKVVLGTSLLFMFFVYLVHPIWNGEYVFQKYFWINVPEYYEEVNQFLNKDTSDSRILILPTLPFHGVRYTWGYRGDEPSKYFFDKPAISKKIFLGFYTKKYDELSEAFINKPDQINKVLNELNIRYIVINNDIDWKAVGSNPPNDFLSNINRNKNIAFIKSFGNLQVYEYKPNIPLGFISAVGEVSPKITYKKISQTHYEVHITNAQEPFGLVFKESYNGLWEARVDDKKVDEHFLVYDYANGWKINKTGDYEIDIVLKVWPWD